ncbi:MAG TPA: DedA family protein [Ktedonobacterales bacterium]|jgi:membrane protein DedA with SNARE-associated domain
MLDLSGWLDALRQVYDQAGYPLVFLGTLGENTALLGLLLPGSTLAVLGGFYARQGALNLWWVLPLAWCGTVLGYTLDYAFGRLVLGRMAGQWGTTQLGRRLRLAGRMRMARTFLARHGGKAILLSHIVGHIRSFVALGAGASQMRFRRFLGFELVAGLLWSSLYVLIGYLVGAEQDLLLRIIERSGWVILAAAVAGYLLYRLARPHLRRHLRQRAKERRAQRLAALPGRVPSSY